jgi:NAD(P)H-flavin reductase
MWKWYHSKVIQIEPIAPTTRRFWLQIEGDEPFEFKAGQFVTMDLPISEKRLKRWRLYADIAFIRRIRILHRAFRRGRRYKIPF